MREKPTPDCASSKNGPGRRGSGKPAPGDLRNQLGPLPSPTGIASCCESQEGSSKRSGRLRCEHAIADSPEEGAPAFAFSLSAFRVFWGGRRRRGQRRPIRTEQCDGPIQRIDRREAAASSDHALKPGSTESGRKSGRQIAADRPISTQG